MQKNDISLIEYNPMNNNYCMIIFRSQFPLFYFNIKCGFIGLICYNYDYFNYVRRINDIVLKIIQTIVIR